MKHILIDFENVRPKDLDALDTPDEYQIWLFLGVHQTNMPLSLVKGLLSFPEKHIHFVELKRQGKNALDHYISFHLGRISEKEQPSHIYIVSKDTGYDVLVEYINSEYNIQVVRVAGVESITHTWQDTETESVVEMSGNSVTVTTQLSLDPNNFTDEDITTVYADTDMHLNHLIPSLYEQDVDDIWDAQTLEEHCYNKILHTLKQPDVFLPHFKVNLQSAMLKHLLEADVHFNDNAEQVRMIDALYKRLLDEEVVIENGKKISYSFQTKISSYKKILHTLIELPQEKRPKDKKALTNWLNNKFASQISAEKVTKAVDKLIKKKKIAVSDKDKIEYLLD